MPHHAASSVWRVPALAVLCLTVLFAVGYCAYGACRVCAGAGEAKRARAMGIGLVLLVVLLWTSSSVVIQLVFEEAHFLKPFFLTWYNFALLTVYLPFYPRELCQLGVALRDSVCSRRGPLRAKYNLVGAAAPPRTASRQDSRGSDDHRGPWTARSRHPRHCVAMTYETLKAIYIASRTRRENYTIQQTYSSASRMVEESYANSTFSGPHHTACATRMEYTSSRRRATPSSIR